MLKQITKQGKITFTILLSIVILFGDPGRFSCAALPIAAQEKRPSVPPVTKDYDPQAERLVVEVASGTDLQSLAVLSGGELVRTGPLNYCTLEYKDLLKKEDTLREVLTLPGVLGAEWSETYRVSSESSPPVNPVRITDPEYELQWALQKVRAPRVWEEGVTGEGVIVAVVDTGVDLTHPDLTDLTESSLVQGYNAFTRSALPGADQDDNGHGTAMAGVIAARPNDKGIVGIAYNAKIMPIKAMDKQGEGEDTIIADGLIWAVDHGAKIINMSIGSEEQAKVLDDAIQYAVNKGCLLVAASGNLQDSQTESYTSQSPQLSTVNTGVSYPGANPHVLAVSAVDMNDIITDFSRTGPEVILSAPGEKILTNYWSETEKGCSYSSGTSIAAPFVSATAALLWSKYPYLTSTDIKQALLSSAYDLGKEGRDKNYGYGRLDAYRALKVLGEQSSFPSPAALGWEGGKIYAVSEAEEPQAILTVSPGTFPLQVDQNAIGRKITISLASVKPPGDFPNGIIPASEAFHIKWGEALAEKALSLKLKIIQQDNQGQKIAYLYRWSNSRWIRAGGGVPESAGEIEVTFFEPGTYRLGLSPEPETSRIYGEDRITTALEIAQQAFPTGADTIVLARADDFPDALAGAPLAYKFQAPILLTYSDRLPQEVSQAIAAFQPKKIFILGGTGAVSLNVENKLRSLTAVERIAGGDRYLTAAAVASKLKTKGQAIVVNSANFPDAISAASHAAYQGKPILLTSANTLVPSIEDTLNKYSVTKTEVIGGTGAINNPVLARLPEPERISGPDRFATSAEVINTHKPQGRILFLATGLNFPDALTGGILASSNTSNIMLLPSTGPTEAQLAVLKNIGARKVLALGGELAVSEDVIRRVEMLTK